MKKNIKCIPLLFLSLFLIVGCAKTVNEKPSEPENSSDIFSGTEKDHQFENFDPNHMEGEDYTEEVERYNNHVNDVDKKYLIQLVVDESQTRANRSKIVNSVLRSGTIDDLIVVDNANEGKVQVRTIPNSDPENPGVTIAPKDGEYEEGTVHTATLNDDRFNFKDKDPSVRTIYFDTEREDTMDYQLSDDLSYFDVRHVLVYPEADPYENNDPESPEAIEHFANYEYTMLYETDAFSHLKEGDNFVVCPFVSGQAEIDDKNSFYGKFSSSTKVDNGYEIKYKNADLTEIYDDCDESTEDPNFDVHQNESEVKSYENIKSHYDESELREELEQNQAIQFYANALARMPQNTRGLDANDFIKHMKIDLKVWLENQKWCFKMVVTVMAPFFKGALNIYVQLTFQMKFGIYTSASLSVKKFAGIPYKINFSFEVKEDKYYNLSVRIGVLGQFPTQELEDSFEETCRSSYAKLLEEKGNSWYSAKKPSKEGAVANGGEFTFRLFSCQAPILGSCFIAYFDFEVFIDLQVSASGGYNYSSHTVKRVLSFSTSGGTDGTSNTEKVSDSSSSFTFIGEFHSKFGLRMTAGINVCGLKNLLSVNFCGEAAIYFDLKGVAVIDLTHDVTTGGFDLEFGFYIGLYLRVNILFIHFRMQLCAYKLPIAGVHKACSVVSIDPPEKIFIDKEITFVSDLDILQSVIFDPNDVCLYDREFALRDRIKYQNGSKAELVKPFELTIDSPFIEIDESNNAFKIKDAAPYKFTTNLHIKVNPKIIAPGVSKNQEYDIKVDYFDPDAQGVKIEGTDAVCSLRPGKTVTLPQLQHVESMDEDYTCSFSYDEQYNLVANNFEYDKKYYHFRGFKIGDTVYEPGTTITMPNEYLVITPILDVIIYYTATFYNSKGEVIGTSRVEEKTSAEPPQMAEIMQNMDGYAFYGWDTDFSYMTKDINVYGIYYKLSGGPNE